MQPAQPGSTGGPQLGVLLAIFDFPLLVSGYRAVIDAQPDMAVVGVAGTRDAMREEIVRTAADIVVAECQGYGGAGCASFQAIEEIRAADPATRIGASACRCGSEQYSLAIKAGADGYLTRQAEPADVLSALRCVSRGERYVSPAIVTRMVNTYVLRTAASDAEDAFESLSERAREVFRLAAVGHSNREIARTLHVSEQTVHNHRATIMERLGFHDRVELVKYALRRGLIGVTEL